MDDGRVELLDAGTGTSTLEQPIQARRGVRAVPDVPPAPEASSQPDNARRDSRREDASEAVFYCHDRYSVYCIAVSEPRPTWPLRSRLKWRVGDAPETPTTGDPEFLPGILATHATTDGVLVLSNDGRLALLHERGGAVAWTAALDRPAVAQLFVQGDLGALLWKHGSDSSVAFVDLTAPEADRLRIRRIPDGAWPAFRGMFAEQVVTYDGKRLTTYAANGRVREHAAESQRVVGWAEGRLVVVGIDGSLRAIDPQTGEAAWERAPAEQAQWRIGSGQRTVFCTLDESQALVVDSRTGTLWRTPSGPHKTVLPQGTRFPSSLVDVAVRRGRLFGVAAIPNPERIMLPKDHFLVHLTPDADHGEVTARLGRRFPTRQVIWTDNALVLWGSYAEEARRLVAFPIFD